MRAIEIERLRDTLIDEDILVDDARRELGAAIDRLRAAVAERDDTMRRLLAAVSAQVAA
jgi:hypothetical protein